MEDSQNNWKTEDLAYFKIEVVNIEIPITDIDHFSERGREFLKITKKMEVVFPSSSIGGCHRYFRQCYYDEDFENTTDLMIKEFFEKIFDPKVFYVDQNHNFELKTKYENKKVTPFLTIGFLPKKLRGIIVIRDKNNIFGNKFDSEEQAISEAIAVAQQKNWPKALNVFFFIVRNNFVNCYQGNFSEVQSAIAKGKNPPKITWVGKYSQNSQIKQKGFNLSLQKGREELARIIYQIEKYYKNIFC